MNYERRDVDGVTVAAFEGHIDVSRAPQLRTVLEELLAEPGARVVVDLSQVPFIDSSGLGILVTAHRKADGAGAAFALASPPPPLERVFQMTRTNKLLRIFATVDEAVEAVSR